MVTISRRPALLPTSAMPGAISPSIRRGIMNPNRLEKILLMVANSLESHSGKKNPQATPRAMAMIICRSKGNFLFFIVACLYDDKVVNISFSAKIMPICC